MARRRKRKPTLAQCLVGVATAGMPPPVRSVLGTRLGSLLMMIALPILVITGVVSIQWNSGLPQVSIDRQRAKEFEAKAVDSLQKLREQENGLLTLRPRFASQNEVAEPEPQQGEHPIANLSEILKTMR
ncbi:MAG: hypothetical protein MUE50_00920 [Pirellulaceae bacterium]|jgi:hypothetical protein|nr:hypothetical protein [Pirellulaceae bacterium]